jgi:hypothetical protein
MTIRASPKFFFCAFGWEAFSILAIYLGVSSVSAEYYFLTGLGDFLGILLGFLAVTILFYQPAAYNSEFQYALLVATAAGLVPGSVWQLSLNIAQFFTFNYTAAFFFVFMMSMAVFFAAVVVLRFLNDMLPDKHRLLWDGCRDAIWHDFLLSIAIGSADAFFTGTDTTMFKDNWLAPAFGIYPDTSAVMAMCLSGASSLAGYLVAQAVLNLVVVENWTDPGEDLPLVVHSLSTLISQSLDPSASARDEGASGVGSMSAADCEEGRETVGTGTGTGTGARSDREAPEKERLLERRKAI